MKLGVNIDHVATLRNARGVNYPSVIEAAFAAIEGGADFITVHLREDRRHINDTDLRALSTICPVPLNIECALAPATLDVVIKAHPRQITLVPENRAELTTEGGLDLGHKELLATIVRIKRADIRVSLFIDADPDNIERIKAMDARLAPLLAKDECGNYKISDSKIALALANPSAIDEKGYLLDENATLKPCDVTERRGFNAKAYFDAKYHEIETSLQGAAKEVGASVKKGFNAKAYFDAMYGEKSLVGIDGVELHTGEYANIYLALNSNIRHCEARGFARYTSMSYEELSLLLDVEIEKLERSASAYANMGLGVYAGHGLDHANVSALASIPHITELNIGHAIVARALILGLANAVSEIKIKI